MCCPEYGTVQIVDLPESRDKNTETVYQNACYFVTIGLAKAIYLKSLFGALELFRGNIC